MKIVIEMEVNAPLGMVWDAWVAPEDIIQWNFAVDEWCCPNAELDFTEIAPFKLIRYRLEDDREVEVTFMEIENDVKVIEEFVAEDENSAEQQKQGWLGILRNFKKHVESKCNVQ